MRYDVLRFFWCFAHDQEIAKNSKAIQSVAITNVTAQKITPSAMLHEHDFSRNNIARNSCNELGLPVV